MAMGIWIIFILAIVQGAAELLPVSSSAHVIFISKLLNLDPSSPENTFLLVMLHTCTMFAAIYFFWPRWKKILTGESRIDFLKMVVIATACTGVLGLGLKVLIERIIMEKMLRYEHGEVEALFKEMPLIAVALFLVGILILIAGRKENGTAGLTERSSIAIGLIQGLCLPFRGFSRSGATISTGLLSGVSRELAEEFSFALAVVLTPPVILLELKRLVSHRATAAHVDIVPLLVPGVIGMILSFIAGIFALKLLSNLLESGRWKFFGYYCLGFSAVIFVSSTFFGL